jgi:Xaa-Pro aminopeptidase
VQEALGAGSAVLPTYGVVDGLRAVKEPEELEAIRTAVELADAAFAHILTVARPGVTERKLAWEVEAFLRTHGAEGVAFAPIVASGPNASKPHHTPSARPIQVGEPIIIDWGAVVGDYCSDITRTLVLGKADEKFQCLYSIVLEAQIRAEERIRAGMTGAEAFAIALEVAEAAGEGEHYGRSLGHGVGLAIHESPWLRLAQENVLADGMVFSVEPGLYVPSWGGIRIEDLVVLQGGRPVVLSRSPKELEAVVVMGVD